MRGFVKRRYLALVLFVFALVSGAAAVAATHVHWKFRQHKKRDPVQFVRDIKPILDAHCVKCHGPTKAKGGLRLDSVAGLWHGGDRGGTIIPGDPFNSLLAIVLTGTEDGIRMPPAGDTLSENQVALIKLWIQLGAITPKDSEPEMAPSAPPAHWAFRPPVAAPVPAGHGPGGNPIDAFLSVAREEHGLTPNPPAPRAAPLRRLYIDLVGVPPTREELVAFLADASEDAYEKVVDRLLASSGYGERWARHWMDVWRYSDADGRKSKASIWWSSPHLWRWRDWIVRSLNEDKGYDRMVLEMLAGDEIAPEDPGTLAATGFLVRNFFKLDRNVWLGNTVEHTAKAFLGLTLGCARCHDHKFDPISQKEYYQFRAIFEPHDIQTDPVPGETGPAALIDRTLDAKPEEPTWLFVHGDARTPDKSALLLPGIPAVLGAMAPPTPPASGGTGRRSALARWIGDRGNPLAARVAVNHIWARHFGRPLVENVADFGTRTPPPIQQPLLDWLAVEFVSHGGSMKHIHRLIVTSAAYRMHSSALNAPAPNLSADPDNQFYWRANSKRMEAEVIRDSMLHLAGVLDPAAGGPPVDCAKGTTTGRRSLYYRYSREDKMELLTAFDAPAVEECYRREQSVVPQQALALENSEFSWALARRIARRLEVGCTSPEDFITVAFEHVLGRPPEPAERVACETFLARLTARLRDPSQLTPLPPVPLPTPVDPKLIEKAPGLPLVLGEAKPLPPIAPAGDPPLQAHEYLVHALLNHNDFMTIR